MQVVPAMRKPSFPKHQGLGQAKEEDPQGLQEE